MQKTLLGLLSILMCVLTLNAANPSGSLPVMYIDTEGNVPITSKTDYVKGTYYLDPMGNEDVEAFGTAAKPLPLQIRGRGNFTWVGFDKKPYRLKLDKKAALFGEAKSKHWALLAHADDNKGFLRNTVGFQLSRLVGLPWTPADHPVEVVLNGDYIGLYFLTETIRVDKDRVDVWDYDSAYEDYADANPGQTLPWDKIYETGGWLCEIDNYDDDAQVKIKSLDRYNYAPDGTMRITYDTPSDYITKDHKTWLVNEMETIDKMIVNGDRSQCEWADKIDIHSLAQFYVVNQIVFNYESFSGSCKLWREQGEDSKWHFGPVWDFGSGFQTDDVAHFLFEWGPYSNHWIRTCYEYPAFQEEVVKVYKELMETNYASVDAYIDNFVEKITRAAEADYQRWNYKGYGNNDMSDDMATVKRMLSRSVNWLNHKWLGAEYSEDELGPTTDIYLRGNCNGWAAQSNYKFHKADDGTYRLFLSHLEGAFKLAGPIWGDGNVDLGLTNKTLDLEKATPLDSRGANIFLTVDKVDNVTLILDWQHKTLLATQHPDEEFDIDDYYTVYFRNIHSTPWEKVNVFTFNPMAHGNWPGTPAMIVNANGEDLWMHKFDKKHNEGDICLIFNNGKSGKGVNQTEDLPLHDNGIYTLSGFTGEYVKKSSNLEINSVDVLAPVEYYNMQGIRVENPSNGIFIRRQGSNTRIVKM